MKSVEHARFCPYCGKQLSVRSNFCPHCGKASPRRPRPGPLAVEGAPAAAAKPPAERSDRPRTITLKQPQRHSPTTELAEPVEGFERSLASKPATPRPGIVSRAKAARQYAPPTHALIGRFEQAGFGLRYGAWMFDFLITLIAMMSFTFVVTAASNRSVVGSNRDLVIVSGLTLLLFVLNFVVFAGIKGQSAGMRILGIRVVRVDGSRFSLKHAALRHLVGYPMSMVAGFLGFLWILWDPSQQGWHDKLAGTVVVMSR